MLVMMTIEHKFGSLTVVVGFAFVLILPLVACINTGLRTNLCFSLCFRSV